MPIWGKKRKPTLSNSDLIKFLTDDNINRYYFLLINNMLHWRRQLNNIIHAHAKAKLCHNLFLDKILYMNIKSDFIQPMKLVINYHALQKFLVYVMFSAHNMGWSNNQTCLMVSYRFFYILFHGLSKITLVVPFLMFQTNFDYLFPAMISFVNKILLINRIHCKCLEKINTLLCHLSRSAWC